MVETEPRRMWVPLIAEYVRRNGHEVDAEAANEVFERRILDNSDVSILITTQDPKNSTLAYRIRSYDSSQVGNLSYQTR